MILQMHLSPSAASAAHVFTIHQSHDHDLHMRCLKSGARGRHPLNGVISHHNQVAVTRGEREGTVADMRLVLLLILDLDFTASPSQLSGRTGVI